MMCGRLSGSPKGDVGTGSGPVSDSDNTEGSAPDQSTRPGAEASPAVSYQWTPLVSLASMTCCWLLGVGSEGFVSPRAAAESGKTL